MLRTAMTVLPAQLAIEPLPRSFNVTIADLPGSKSLTNRALLLSTLAHGRSTLTNVLFSDDTRVMMTALEKLGFQLKIDEMNRIVQVNGHAGTIPTPHAKLHLGNAGTAYRFLTAACSLGKGTYTLDGDPRMHQRPVGQLVDALRQLGARIKYLGADGYPPLGVTSPRLSGGEVIVPQTLSSQYISALLQIAAYCDQQTILELQGTVTSQPYVAMTLGLIRRFGVEAQVQDNFKRITISPSTYRATDYAIEPDASNASYFLAAAATVPGGKCTIGGLGKSSLQGDIGFADLLQQMGADMLFGKDFITVMAPPETGQLRGIDVDLNHMPDMAQTLAVVALFARGDTVIRNVGNLRIKETDRLAALQNELTKLGAVVAIEDDDLFITPPPDGRIKPAAIDTYDDHRMAMSFAVAALRAPGIIIRQPGCVSKTFPGFFGYLDRLRDAPAATD